MISVLLATELSTFRRSGIPLAAVAREEDCVDVVRPGRVGTGARRAATLLLEVHVPGRVIAPVEAPHG